MATSAAATPDAIIPEIGNNLTSVSVRSRHAIRFSV
jgi:hypothetical protein